MLFNSEIWYRISRVLSLLAAGFVMLVGLLLLVAVFLLTLVALNESGSGNQTNTQITTPTFTPISLDSLPSLQEECIVSDTFEEMVENIEITSRMYRECGVYEVLIKRPKDESAWSLGVFNDVPYAFSVRGETIVFTTAVWQINSEAWMVVDMNQKTFFHVDQHPFDNE